MSIGLTLGLAVLAACATPQVLSGRAFHAFDFDPGRQSVNTEALSYQYGDSKEFRLQTNPEDIARGKTGYGVKITGDLPVGDFLDVKWRNTLTGKVYEDRVDLKSRLPSSMDRQRLLAIIEGAQLYVYVISFDPVRPYFTREAAAAIDHRAAENLRLKTLSSYARNRVIQIYPERLVDPHLPPSLRN